jgi:hypothetical protein
MKKWGKKFKKQNKEEEIDNLPGPSVWNWNASLASEVP